MEVFITLDDARAVPKQRRYCARGMRIFCATHNISWDRFITEGIPLSEVEHIDDQMLSKIIEKAKERCQQNQTAPSSGTDTI